jgi:ADP-ribosyl-[dinitrogen reductase] hydrolase
MGQVAGDSLGSLVEFKSAASIERQYPGGPRLLADGGTWKTLAGQPTDDSELALALARELVSCGGYDEQKVKDAYSRWFASGPFDVGGTIAAALSPGGAARRESQANGALMRVSPLGILGARLGEEELSALARADASLTHPHEVCPDSNVVYTAAIAFAVRTGAAREMIYEHALKTMNQAGVCLQVRECLREAALRPPADFIQNQGWVLLALQNAFYQLLHSTDFEQGVVDTVRRGGDTDTNAAIAGALLGAACGLDAVPRQWRDCVLECRPERGREGVCRPRPREYWPVDVLTLAGQLLGER